MILSFITKNYKAGSHVLSRDTYHIYNKLVVIVIVVMVMMVVMVMVSLAGKC